MDTMLFLTKEIKVIIKIINKKIIFKVSYVISISTVYAKNKTKTIVIIIIQRNGMAWEMEKQRESGITKMKKQKKRVKYNYLKFIYHCPPLNDIVILFCFCHCSLHNPSPFQSKVFYWCQMLNNYIGYILEQ